MEFLVLVAAVWIVIALGRRLALALSPAGRWERRLRNAWRKLRLREVSRREADRELSRVIRLAAEAGHSPRLERFSHSPECTDTEARVAAELAIKADSEEEEDRFRKGMEAYLQRLRGEARGREQASSTPGGSRAGDSQQAKRHSFPRNRESLPELWREAGLCVACGVRNIRDHSLGGSYCWETCRPTGDDDAPPLPVNAAPPSRTHPPDRTEVLAIIELRQEDGRRDSEARYWPECSACGEVFQWKKFSSRKKITRRHCRHCRLPGTSGVRAYLPTLIAEQRGLCGICGEPLSDDLGAVHVDHIRPRAHGGTNGPENLQAAHASCNLAKGASLPD